MQSQPESNQQPKLISQRGQMIINAILFQLGWFGCVLGGELIALIITPVLLFIHSAWIMKSRQEWRVIAIITFIGITVDSLLAQAGILNWSSSQHGFPIPLWLCCLWLLFATTLKHSLSWLNKHRALPIVLGAIAGTCSYWSGSVLSDIELRQPLEFSLLWIGLSWSLTLPLYTWIAKNW